MYTRKLDILDCVTCFVTQWSTLICVWWNHGEEVTFGILELCSNGWSEKRWHWRFSYFIWTEWGDNSSRTESQIQSRCHLRAYFSSRMLVFNLETAELFWVLIHLTLCWRDFPCSSMFNSFIFLKIHRPTSAIFLSHSTRSSLWKFTTKV